MYSRQVKPGCLCMEFTCCTFFNSSSWKFLRSHVESRGAFMRACTDDIRFRLGATCMFQFCSVWWPVFLECIFFQKPGFYCIVKLTVALSYAVLFFFHITSAKCILLNWNRCLTLWKQFTLLWANFYIVSSSMWMLRDITVSKCCTWARCHVHILILFDAMTSSSRNHFSESKILYWRWQLHYNVHFTYSLHC